MNKAMLITFPSKSEMLDFLQSAEDNEPFEDIKVDQKNLQVTVFDSEGNLDDLTFALDDEELEWEYIKESKEKSMNKIIEITEEIQIPGTDIILEAGDKIQVIERVTEASITEQIAIAARNAIAMSDFIVATEVIKSALRLAFQNEDGNSKKWLSDAFNL